VAGVFDYVIVGGGSAGCVLAARLAEDPGTRVLLLEAGPAPDDVDEIHVPAAYNRLFRTKYDWNYVTIAAGLLAARPGARRQFGHERDDLHPR
jgi:choline dehydrogenase-like flavoprotein